MKNLISLTSHQMTAKILISAVVFAASYLQGATPVTIFSDNFDDIPAAPISRTNGKLRADESGPTYLINGNLPNSGTFDGVDASSIGGNFSGTALEVNFKLFDRALYVPFPDPGWKVGDKIKLTFDFAYAADPGDQKTSLWMTLQSQGDLLATTDFSRYDATYLDDSGHALKLAEKSADVSSSSIYGFANARMHSQSANFYEGPSGVVPYIVQTNPVNVAFELECVQKQYTDPLFPGQLLDGTVLSIYIDGVLVDSSTVTALVASNGSYNAFCITARGPAIIDNITIEHTSGPVIPIGLVLDFTGVSDVSLTFDAVAGQTYQLEKSTGDLNSFLPVGSAVLSDTGGDMTLVDTGGEPTAGEKALYRVSVTN